MNAMERKIEAGVYTIKGSFREQNEDNFLVNHRYRYQDEAQEDRYARLVPPFICLLCDGMGGTGYGREASQAVVQSFAQNEEQLISRQTEASINQILENLIQKANQRVVDLRRIGKKTGSTLALTYFEENKIYYANIGDSKIFEFKGNQIRQLSVDHNQAAMLLEMEGKEFSARQSKVGRNRLTQYLGIPSSEFVIEPHYGELEFEDMILLICSDGLMEKITEKTLTKYLEAYRHFPADEISMKLVEVAQRLGSRDNITAITLKLSQGRKREVDQYE